MRAVIKAAGAGRPTVQSQLAMQALVQRNVTCTFFLRELALPLRFGGNAFD